MEPSTWQQVFQISIMLVIAAGGAPVTQLFKNWFKIEGRWALVLTGAVSAVFATAELWLAGVIGLASFTVQSFPATFFLCFSAASIYYGWMKGSESLFGKKLLLKLRN